MTVALVDGDAVAFIAAITSQEDIDWGDGEEGLTASPQEAAEKAIQTVKEWCEPVDPSKIIVCFSDSDGLNFRRTFGPYKEQRSGKPVVYWPTVEALCTEYPTELIPTLEADDVMGIMATSDRLRGAVIVSPDKDMKTIPAKVHNPRKNIKPLKITPTQADHYLRLQTLTGDRVDGYYGIRGIGPKKAAKILAEGDDWATVRRAYLDASMTEGDFLMNARMARILRCEDFDKEKGEIRIWHPIPKRAEWRSIEDIATELQRAQGSEAQLQWA